MAKTIKFNLICDGNPIRTIEDLQDHFSVEDILDYYRNGLLCRWLTVRGYEDQLHAVNAITSKETMDVIKELIHIFDVEADEKKIEQSIYMLQYTEECKELLSCYKDKRYKVKHIIDDYFTGYGQLVDDIFQNPNNVALIKANIEEMASQYEEIFKLDNRALFWKLKNNNAYLAIMCLLMNEKTRNYYLPVEEIDDDEKTYFDTEKNADKREMFDEIKLIIRLSDFKDILGDNLISFAGATDSYWKDLEPKGKQCMVITMGNGDVVRAAGKINGDLTYDDILDKFVIIDGVDYKSNSDLRELHYMEV